MPIRLLPERYFATRASDQKGAYGRLLWDWPAYTVTNAANNVTAGPFTHPDDDRPISVREAARLQSFDDYHVFFGSVLSEYRKRKRRSTKNSPSLEPDDTPLSFSAKGGEGSGKGRSDNPDNHQRRA